MSGGSYQSASTFLVGTRDGKDAFVRMTQHAKYPFSRPSFVFPPLCYCSSNDDEESPNLQRGQELQKKGKKRGKTGVMAWAGFEPRRPENQGKRRRMGVLVLLKRPEQKARQDAFSVESQAARKRHKSGKSGIKRIVLEEDQSSNKRSTALCLNRHQKREGIILIGRPPKKTFEAGPNRQVGRACCKVFLSEDQMSLTISNQDLATGL
jgi:hypothetical protein